MGVRFPLVDQSIKHRLDSDRCLDGVSKKGEAPHQGWFSQRKAVRT